MGAPLENIRTCPLCRVHRETTGRWPDTCEACNAYGWVWADGSAPLKCSEGDYACTAPAPGAKTCGKCVVQP